MSSLGRRVTRAIYTKQPITCLEHEWPEIRRIIHEVINEEYQWGGRNEYVRHGEDEIVRLTERMHRKPLRD